MTSAKASVVSEDLSMTGRFLPATTFTLTLPGIASLCFVRWRLSLNNLCCRCQRSTTRIFLNIYIYNMYALFYLNTETADYVSKNICCYVPPSVSRQQRAEGERKQSRQRRMKFRCVGRMVGCVAFILFALASRPCIPSHFNQMSNASKYKCVCAR